MIPKRIDNFTPKQELALKIIQETGFKSLQELQAEQYAKPEAITPSSNVPSDRGKKPAWMQFIPKGRKRR